MKSQKSNIFDSLGNLRSQSKAQTEIMGLAIVIILIILGVAFVIRYSITQEPIKYKTEFTHAELASNILNTLLETTTDCEISNSKLSISELLQNCGQGGGIECNGESPGNYASNIIEGEIFKKTLDEWKIKYEFKVFFDESNQIIPPIRDKIDSEDSCTGSKNSKTYPIPTSSRVLNVKLDICG